MILFMKFEVSHTDILYSKDKVIEIKTNLQHNKCLKFRFYKAYHNKRNIEDCRMEIEDKSNENLLNYKIELKITKDLYKIRDFQFSNKSIVCNDEIQMKINEILNRINVMKILLFVQDYINLLNNNEMIEYYPYNKELIN